MNKVTGIAVKAGRDYITPEDVQQAMDESADDSHGIRIDVLEVLGKQTDFGAEDAGLCAFVAFKGPNVKTEPTERLLAKVGSNGELESMTMPNLMNCEHLADGCCLDCVRKLIEAEREACAKVCDDAAQGWRDSDAEGSESLAYEDRALEGAARAIRMRSNAALRGGAAVPLESTVRGENPGKD